MKELSLEEKAKRYDEAVEKLRRLHDNYDTVSTLIDIKEELENIFPELKESEDERIIERIKKAVESYWSDEPLDEILAWLEKQGEQKDVNEDAEKEKYDYVSGQFLYCKGSFNEFKEGESYWLEYIGNDTYVGRSDNILNQKFHITPRQLYTWLDPRHPEDSNKCEQKPWSEEDEYCKHQLISFCENCMAQDACSKRCAHWLKSLKERYTWKPSEEQMHYLSWVANIKLGDSVVEQEVSKHLNELLEQLKKLKE